MHNKLVHNMPHLNILYLILLLFQCIHVELEHKAVVIAKPEPRRKHSSHIDINSFSDLVRTETPQSQNFFFDLVFGPRYATHTTNSRCALERSLSLSLSLFFFLLF